jgi:hypothetical protein
MSRLSQHHPRRPSQPRAQRHSPRCAHVFRSATFAACLFAASFTQANDALKAQSTQSAQSVQRVQQQTFTRPPSTTMPTAPATMPKPPTISDAVKAQATTVSPALRTSDAITGLGDGGRGVVAGESLTIRGRGFGASAGRVEISVQTGASSNSQLPFRVTKWSDTEISGNVGASLGLGDGKASITIFPAGRSVADAITSSQSSVPGATHNGWRFRFTATRAEQTLAINGLGSALTSSYPNPAAQLIPHGSGLLKGLAVARRYQAAPLGCTEAPPSDRYKLALANGFELVRVAAKDLNADKRYGLAAPDVCDVRSSMQAPQFLRTASDGSFVVSPGWDVVNRYGPKSKVDCDMGKYMEDYKSPLGFSWQDIGRDRCAANSEYVIDHLIVRGPAGVSPLTGGAMNGAAIK